MTILYHTPEGNKRPPETANELEHATAMAMAKDHWDSIEANRKKDYPSMTEKEAYGLISGMISLCELKSSNYYFETDYDLHKYSDLVDVFLGIEFIMDMIETQIEFGNSFKEAVKEVKESYENDLVELSEESNKIIANRVKLELTDSEVKAIKVWEQIAKKEVTKAFNKYKTNHTHILNKRKNKMKKQIIYPIVLILAGCVHAPDNPYGLRVENTTKEEFEYAEAECEYAVNNPAYHYKVCLEETIRHLRIDQKAHQQVYGEPLVIKKKVRETAEMKEKRKREEKARKEKQFKREMDEIKYNRAYTKCAHLFGLDIGWRNCIDKSIKEDERKFDFFR